MIPLSHTLDLKTCLFEITFKIYTAEDCWWPISLAQSCLACDFPVRRPPYTTGEQVSYLQHVNKLMSYELSKFKHKKHETNMLYCYAHAWNWTL